MKKNNLQTAIYKTLIYSDIFESPLNLHEIHRYLYRYSITKNELRLFLKTCGFVKKIGSYYVLSGREKIVPTHRAKARESKRKTTIGQSVSYILSKIPTISFIGISGSVATRSATKDADVDLFIITREHTLWLTRIAVTTVLYIIGRKRSVHVGIAPDAICTNMWMSDDHLELPQRNLFIAREVVQMQVVVDKNNTYTRFLHANSWIYSYFPNLSKTEHISNSGNILSKIFAVINIPVYIVQRLYMKRKQTIERISLHYAAFHPKDISNVILRIYAGRLRTYRMTIGSKKDKGSELQHITPGS